MASSNYLILDPALHKVANIAKQEVMSRYNLRRSPFIEQSITSSIYWRPTFYWQRETEYLAIEVSDRPLPSTLKSEFMDISSSGLPIRIIVAYPENNKLSTTEFQKDINRIRQTGIGYMSVDEIF